MRIVLVEPEIPPNTGNIARTAAATGTPLDLIEPLGFSLDDRYLRRAGVDYWHLVDVSVYPNWEAFWAAHGDEGRLHLFTARGGANYADVAYSRHDLLVFGRESVGLPERLLGRFPEAWRRIPMVDTVRSLNLSNAVALALYEALRQQGFPGLGAWAEPRS